MLLKKWSGTDISFQNHKDLYEYIDLEEIITKDKISLRNAIYSSTSEIIANIIHHAYPQDGTVSKSWEIQISKNNQVFTISIRDHGISIPESLSRKLNKNFTNVTDCDLIQETFTPKILNFENGRGLGIPSLFEKNNCTHFSAITISSRNGQIHYDTTWPLSIKPLSIPFLGTEAVLSFSSTGEQ